MPVDDFKTVPEELLHVASDAETHFTNEGFEVTLETREIGFPFTPTLVCRRGHETVIVEVSSSLDIVRTERWVRYCKSQTVDTRYCAIIRSQSGVDQLTMDFVVRNWLGLCVHNDQELMVIRPPTDLAVHVALPEIRDLPRAVRPLLAPAFRKVQENDWRDGLNHAYSEVEQLAREYLKQGIDSGRTIVTMRRSRRMINLTSADVDTMTLGQLKDAFALIQNQTHKDAVIGTTLAMINKTRVGLAHRRRSQAVEAELRLQVGQNMYAAITCLEELTT